MSKKIADIEEEMEEHHQEKIIYLDKERGNISFGSQISEGSQYSTAVGIDALEK